MMADPLDLVHLRTLVAIAETGGFRRAADALHLSQPTVSQHVRLLEKRLRQTLLTKDGRGSRFTSNGERLLVEARRLLAAHEQALQRLRVEEVDDLTIGSSEHAADYVLPELLGVLREAYPEVSLQFRLDRSTALSDAVNKGTLDLAIVLGGNDGEEVGTEVGRLDLRWVAAEGWQAPEPGARVPVVVFESPCGLRRRAIRKLFELGHDVFVAVESTSLDGVLAATRAGLGVALLPFFGPVPSGLRELTDIPSVGDIDLRLVARRALSIKIEDIAIKAVSDHFASIPRENSKADDDVAGPDRRELLRVV
ncbi:LysR family transcriptional regulator [Rhodococcus globerulus]|uniref:LysR family transcriptional regulator n=1 Tax=Rhodococcus globerulus TaxID=33008 RepID=A0ABU4C4V1_RHOGO|nr:LysR family transcriptional regulator [Rhodococcus globerulus]MDV6271440.1 LysR family transcriptional regulator [Rhodococcus globerulus]